VKVDDSVKDALGTAYRLAWGNIKHLLDDCTAGPLQVQEVLSDVENMHGERAKTLLWLYLDAKKAERFPVEQGMAKEHVSAMLSVSSKCVRFKK
jgi:hypothetical protein